jgi:hypothetical protein
MLPTAITNISWLLGLMACLGAFGKFLDFYIGKKASEKVKDWLLVGWIRFDDMHWGSFAEVEAVYVITLLDRFVGSRFFSARRLVATLTISVSALILILTEDALVPKKPCLPSYEFSSDALKAATIWVVASILLAASFSVSRSASLIVIRLSKYRWSGPAPYIFLLMFNWMVLVYWRPLVHWLAFVVQNSDEPRSFLFWAEHVFSTASPLHIGPELHRLAHDFTSQAHQASCGDSSIYYQVFINLFGAGTDLLGDVASLWRLVLGGILLAAFLLREVLARFISTVWRRIYEDNQGTFTLLLGGLGAVAGGLKAILS